jgi:hypothetical protein
MHYWQAPPNIQERGKNAIANNHPYFLLILFKIYNSIFFVFLHPITFIIQNKIKTLMSATVISQDGIMVFPMFPNGIRSCTINRSKLPERQRTQPKVLFYPALEKHKRGERPLERNHAILLLRKLHF